MARSRYGDLLAANNIRKRQENQNNQGGGSRMGLRRERLSRPYKKGTDASPSKNNGRESLGRTVRRTLREVMNETPRGLGNTPRGLGNLVMPTSSHTVRRVMSEANRQKASPLRKRKPR